MNELTPVVVISGPVGVGKTSVGWELTECLEEAGIPHTFVDYDVLRATYPRPAGDRWGNKLGYKNLADIWRNCAEAGSRNLIIADVVEDSSTVDALNTCVPDASITVVQLSATTETLAERVRQRELGTGLEWHLNRSMELAELLTRPSVPADLRQETDGLSLRDIAASIQSKINWLT